MAETIRTSTATLSVPPTRSNFRSSRKRSSFTWAPREISPTSSRNTVPPLATSNLPAFCRMAPVNEPFSWPKSSLSRSVSGIDAQLIASNGPFTRELL